VASGLYSLQVQCAVIEAGTAGHRGGDAVTAPLRIGSLAGVGRKR
jgi:hypothetical protein